MHVVLLTLSVLVEQKSRGAIVDIFDIMLHSFIGVICLGIHSLVYY
jgi:hypothetical protein